MKNLLVSVFRAVFGKRDKPASKVGLDTKLVVGSDRRLRPTPPATLHSTATGRVVTSWPYLWGAPDGPNVVAIYANKYYVFPECERPSEVPNLREFLLKERVSVKQSNLGAQDVVLTGQQFINELRHRGLIDTIGEWTKRDTTPVVKKFQSPIISRPGLRGFESPPAAQQPLPASDPWPTTSTDDFSQRFSTAEPKTPNHVPNFHSNGGTFDGGGSSGDWDRTPASSSSSYDSGSSSSSSSCDSGSSSSSDSGSSSSGGCD